MDVFSTSVDLVRIVFLLGAVLALIYKKKIGVTPGGIIVPGILAGIMFTSFVAFMFTIASTILCWVIYKFSIAKYALSNRWTSLTCISLSVVIGLLATSILGTYKLVDQEALLLSLVTPGLITISAKKYGFKSAAFGVLFVTAVTGALGLLLAKIIPYEQLTSLSVQLGVYTPLALTHPFIVLPISLISAILVYYRFGIRGGGYLIAPFLSVILLSSPFQAILVCIGVAASYLAITLIQKHTLIIGLERFVMSLFCGYFVVTLMDLLATTVNIEGYRTSPIILIIAIAVLTNDLCLQPLAKSLKKGVMPAFIMSFLARLAV